MRAPAAIAVALAVLTLLAAGRSTAQTPEQRFALSGPLELTDADGRPVRTTEFGKWLLVYFGYTHCPDVCPTTVANLAQMAEKVASPDVRILFVTVDPERDTDQVMADYARAFSPQVIGLRGSENQLAGLARTYRVAYQVKKGPPYEVTHSNAVF